MTTPEKTNESVQQLAFLLQTNAAALDPKLSAKILASIVDLQEMPGLAEEIRSFEPTPDPAQQEIQAMQMENMRLENELLKTQMMEAQSRINERNTRGLENIEADVGNKNAQAELRLAQADKELAMADKYNSESDKLQSESDKLQSETDVIDNEFIDIRSGAKRQREIDDNEFKEMNEFEKLQVRK